MSLTGTSFLTLVALLTVAVFGLLVVFWSRLAGRTVGQIVGRVSLLALVNSLVLLTASVMLNDTYLFYASWGDLHGALTNTVRVTSLNRGANATVPANSPLGGGSGAPGVAAAAPADVGTKLPTLPNFQVPGYRVVSYKVRGRASGITNTVVVELPPGYNSPANRHRRYPVLETFAGYPGSPYQWSSAMQLGAAISRQVALGHMRQAVIVEPEQWIPADVDTECVNGVGRTPQLETWLTIDVPSWVRHTFRVSTQRSSWATAGLSAGGWCANMATMLHPGQYGAAIDMGGYFRPVLSPFYQPYPRNGRLAARYNLVARARRQPPPVDIWMETSHLDGVSYHSSAAFLNATRAPLSVHAVMVHDAGHRIGVWKALLPQALQWLGHVLPGFAPTPPQTSG